MVISCPCSIAISVPLSYFSGIGKSSKEGILIKGSDYIDAIKDIKEIVFDKTGTLTKGEFEIATEDLKDEDDGDLIVNNDKLNIYYVRISRNEDESINLNLCVKNKFNKNIIVESKDVSVNGIDTNPKFSISVLAGEKSFDKMVFNTDIAELVNLKCIFVIKDENTNEVLEECSIDIFKED